MTQKSKVAQIQAGQFLSETQYYKVNSVHEVRGVEVTNERGLSFNIANDIVEEGVYSAHQYTEEVTVTRTELIAIFTGVDTTVFTVTFHKKPDEADINKAIAGVNKGKILAIADIKKAIKEVYKGEERTLTGYMISTETGFGRSLVIDLEADTSKSTPTWDSRLRQVDHRTLKTLIYKNVKYTAKS